MIVMVAVVLVATPTMAVRDVKKQDLKCAVYRRAVTLTSFAGQQFGDETKRWFLRCIY